MVVERFMSEGQIRRSHQHKRGRRFRGATIMRVIMSLVSPLFLFIRLREGDSDS